MRKHIAAIAFLLLVTCTNAGAEQYYFVTFDFPPYEYATADLKAEGGIVEVVKKVMHNLGHQVSIQPFPWTRALKMVRNGEAHAIFTAYKSPEREVFLDYSREVLFPQSVYFFKKRTGKASFDGDFSALSSKRIGVVSTISYGQVFEIHKPVLQLDRASNAEQSFNKLMKNRVDLVVSDLHVAEYTLAQLGITEEVVRLPAKLESVPSYIAFSKKLNLTSLRGEFDNELARLKLTGEYDEILKKHAIDRHE